MTEPRAVRCKRLVTCDERRGSPLGAIDDAAFVMDGGRVTWLGAAKDLDPRIPIAVDAPDAVVTPGLVDAHTHAAFVGSRHGEYAIRMAGGDYEEIQKAGGGILSSQRAVAAAREEEIAEDLAMRLARMAALGVTTVEVKSGYGLVPDEEIKQLRAIARVRANTRRALPHVVPTFLALHALPKGEDRAIYTDTVTRTLLPAVAAERLARFVDAYVDRYAFQIAEARRVGERARASGLGVRLHVGQFADIGGAELAANLGARSADHLEHISERGAEALAKAGTAAILLPIASFTLGQTAPNVPLLRKSGVAIAVASDANPGTAPTESLPLALAFAVRQYGLSVEEAILGATRVAADSLDEPERGRLAIGGPADFVVWDLPHEAAIVQPWGTSKTRLVVREGATLYAS